MCNEVKAYPDSFYPIKTIGKDRYTKHCRECHKETSRLNRERRYKDDPFREKHYNLKSSANWQNVPYDLDADYLKSIWNGKCAVFGCDILIKTDRRNAMNHAEVDKINPGLGYVRGNVQWVCHRANRLKDNATIEELEMVLANMKRNSK